MIILLNLFRYCYCRFRAACAGLRFVQHVIFDFNSLLYLIVAVDVFVIVSCDRGVVTVSFYLLLCYRNFYARQEIC